MNESIVKPENLGLRPQRTKNETICAVYGFFGFLGGLGVAIATNQLNDIPVSIVEIYGTAASAAFGGTAITEGIRRWRYAHRLSHWLGSGEGLYTQEINTEVEEHFTHGFQTLANWTYRQEKKKR
jgi:hypothetical protein